MEMGGSRNGIDKSPRNLFGHITSISRHAPDPFASDKVVWQDSGGRSRPRGSYLLETVLGSGSA